LADGPHTLTVRSTDPAGNIDPNPVSRSFLVDTAAPSLTVGCPDSLLLNDVATATVTATDSGSGFLPGEDPSGDYPLDSTQPGDQTFSVDALDAAGNLAHAECSYAVTYPAPGVPVVTAGGNPNAGAFTVGWTAAAPDEYGLRYVLQRRDADDSDWSDVATGIAGTAQAFTPGDPDDEGTWAYRVKGSDGEHETPWSDTSVPVKVDQSAPAKPALLPDRAPEYAGDGGWFRDSVTVTTEDRGDPALRDGSPGTGVYPASVVAPETLSSSATLRRKVSDLVGHESEEAVMGVQVDTAKPSLQLDCPGTVLVGGEASVQVTAADDQSGLADDPSGTVQIDTDQPGTHVVERTARDNVGHERTARCEVLVAYDYSGLLEPVNRDGSSVFKLGSTIPLKLRLLDVDGKSVPNVRVQIAMERISTSVEGTQIEEVVDATPTNGKEFQYDEGAELYRFNLSTKPLSVGTWRIRLSLDDGTVHRTQVSLR
jgi:hypothetical protein